MATVKGGTVLIMPIGACYSYVAGVDGIILKKWTGSKSVKPGKRKFVFAASHTPSLKSYFETELQIKEGHQYIVEAVEITEPYATYSVYENPGRVKILESRAPLFIAKPPLGDGELNAILLEKGWKEEK